MLQQLQTHTQLKRLLWQLRLPQSCVSGLFSDLLLLKFFWQVSSNVSSSNQGDGDPSVATSSVAFGLQQDLELIIVIGGFLVIDSCFERICNTQLPKTVYGLDACRAFQTRRRC
jgi:hypothetical protein